MNPSVGIFKYITKRLKTYGMLLIMLVALLVMYSSPNLKTLMSDMGIELKTSLPIVTKIKVNVSRTVLFYNRIPRSGSTTLSILMRQLLRRQHFEKGLMNRSYTFRENQDPWMICKFLRRTLKYAKEVNKSTIVTGYVGFVDPELDCQMPRARVIHISMVPHPVQAFIAHYHLNKQLKENGTNQDESFQTVENLQDYVIPPTSRMHTYVRFCGYNKTCWDPKTSLDFIITRAKENIEKYYAVVGLTDEFDLTLAVLETLLPQYLVCLQDFANALDKEERSHLNYTHTQPSSDVMDILNQRFQTDIKFYEYLKQRLFYQGRALNLK